MKQVQILANTYTGAGFRGFEDPLDDRVVKVAINFETEADEVTITEWLSDNFSYGLTGEDCLSLKQYADKLQDAEEPVFDGCGATFVIKVADEVLVDLCEELTGESAEELGGTDLGTFDVDKLPPDVMCILQQM